MISSVRPFLSRIKSELVDLYRVQLHYGCLYPLARIYHKISTSAAPRASIRSGETPSPLNEESGDHRKNSFGPIAAENSQTRTAVDWPKITLVTVNRNREHQIEACIRSVLEQNYPNLQYLVVDCGSTDGSVEILKRLLNANPDIRFELHENHSAVDVLNAALESANGAIFNWLDPADRLEAGALFKCGQAYKQAPDAAGWIGACCLMAGGVNTVLYPSGVERENILLNWNGRQFAQPSCFLAAAKVKQLAGLNSEYRALFDLDLWVRLLEKWDFYIGEGIWSVTSNASTSVESSELKLITAKNNLNTSGCSNLGSTGGGYIVPPTMQKRLGKLADEIVARPAAALPKKIVVISYSIPRPDKSSAEQRLDFILKLLVLNGYNIHLIYCANVPGDKKYLNVRKNQIECQYLPPSVTDYVACLKEIEPDIILISELWRIAYIEFIAHLVDGVKSASLECKLILDTVDFHYKEFYRKYENSRKDEDLTLAQSYLALERKLYPMVDKITVVTATEKNDIEENLGRVAPIKVVPNIHEVPTDLRAFEERRHICFLGNFGARHNVDAVIYFLDHIFDSILEKNPGVEFHVLGFLAEKYRQLFSYKNVKVVGFLKDINKALSYYKLFACPLTYGAGMKGKIGDAIMAGTPIVTTSIGAEGFEAINGREFFIADDPAEFAAKCCQCLNDEAVWNFMSYSARLMVAENYSPKIINETIKSILL